MSDSSLSSKMTNSDEYRRYDIVGYRCFSNFFWASTVGIGGFYFFFTGLSSRFESNLLPFIHSENIQFFPQGIVMCLYGVVGFFFSLYLWLAIFWKVGEGFNEFNKKTGKVRIFRLDFPGKNRRMNLVYPITDIEGIRLEVIEGFNPKRTIYVRLKDKREIPLMGTEQPLPLDQIEDMASELAMFLQVALDDF